MNALRQHLDLHATALNLREQRNTLLSSNIANAATPGYKARDIDFERELAAMKGESPLRVSSAEHLRSFQPAQGDATMYREPLNPSVDGNTVELQVEQMEFSENTMRYMTSLTFLNSRISGLMSAIKGE